MLIEGQFDIAAPPQVVLQHLFDVRLMASCLPGCESLQPVDDKRYRTVIQIGLAGIKARFELEVEITRQEANSIWAVTRGEEGGRASMLQAESQITLQPQGTGTQVRYQSEVSVTGRLGRFALGMMRKQAQNLGEQFARNLQKALQSLTDTKDRVQDAPATS